MRRQCFPNVLARLRRARSAWPSLPRRPLPCRPRIERTSRPAAFSLNDRRKPSVNLCVAGPSRMRASEAASGAYSCRNASDRASLLFESSLKRCAPQTCARPEAIRFAGYAYESLFADQRALILSSSSARNGGLLGLRSPAGQIFPGRAEIYHRKAFVPAKMPHTLHVSPSK